MLSSNDVILGGSEGSDLPGTRILSAAKDDMATAQDDMIEHVR
jgi:hypothetical protein